MDAQIKKLIKALKKIQKDAVEYIIKEERYGRDARTIGYWQGYNDAMGMAMTAVEHFFETGKCRCKECKQRISTHHPTSEVTQVPPIAVHEHPELLK